MNSRKVISLSAMFALTLIGAMGTATAAVNNMTASGGFRPMNSGSWSGGRSRSANYHRAYAYRAPATVRPQIASSATQVAQAPSEGRRFSYAPSTGQAVSSGCGAAVAPSTATVTESARRFSYAPTTDGAVQAAPMAPSYSSPSHGRRGMSSSRSATPELWSLPKTDPRKFGSR